MAFSSAIPGTAFPQHATAFASPLTAAHVFSSLFLHQFASSKKYQKIPLSLFSMPQGVKEPLRGYVLRFNVAALEVPSASADVLSNAFA
ncbi:hypothetical protein BUALT_BualtUnG0055300 [Buddleja alternifolia]|uniref:Uncharacterized protein n=1 Tax=Buddleja alternifolia TaxID=168488 RepID=A0AAV6W0H5_9LAMI|nr:hypothetical protein BUALT_BualtUnG0055300 [Buddleja alternifolia]